MIAKSFPLATVRQTLTQTKRASVRERDPPAHVVVYQVAGKSGVSQARSRLGPEPLEKLYQEGAELPRRRQGRGYRSP